MSSTDPPECATTSSGCVEVASCSSAPSTPTERRVIPKYDVFLGGSCGNTVWRSQLVIPFLKKRAISYYDPQRSYWSENMIYEESIAKENSSLFLFVLDPATINATSFLEIAYFAARKAPKLVVVFLGRTEWREKAHPEDVPDRVRTCQLLDRILEAHQVPLLLSIEEALTYIDEEIIGTKTWRQALSTPLQRLPYLALRARRAMCTAKETAKRGFQTVRSAASKIAVTGATDAAVVVAMQLAAPAVPIVAVLVPLLLLNLVVLGLITLWRRARLRRPRGVMDSARSVPRASIPIPRMQTVATPLIAKSSRDAVRQSRRWVESLGIAEMGALPANLDNAWRRVSDPPRPDSLPSPAQPSVALTPPADAGGNPPPPRRSPVDHASHLFLGCSSLEELDWVNKQAAPYLQYVVPYAGSSTFRRNEIAYSTVLACESVPPESRMALLKRGSRSFRQVLYHIPSTKTFLSGMVEIAYLLGHSDWQVTLCVSKEAETLETRGAAENEAERAARRRRNDCYAIAFCYLKDMAKRHQCRVFSEIDDALVHCVRLAQTGC